MSSNPESGEGPESSRHRERVVRFFEDLRVDTMHLVDEFYHAEARFRDPLVDIRGRQALRDYYGGLYKEVISIRFDFETFVEEESRLTAEWTMTLAVERLEGKRPFSVPGISRFTFDPETDLVIDHRDYFDLGVFIYERVPVLRSLVRMIKKRLH